MIQLAVWAGPDRVGTLSHDTQSNLFDFSYEEAWQQSPRSFPLSPQMPILPARAQPKPLPEALQW